MASETKRLLIHLFCLICTFALLFLSSKTLQIDNVKRFVLATYTNGVVAETISINNTISEEIDISFIIGSRNDNYGENPILRLRFTLQNLLLFEWKKLYNVSIEVIIIEWNTVNENPHLWQYDEIKTILLNKNDDTKIKFYSVPSFYNDNVNCKTNQYCPYFEYPAKNVGIRRSSGKWKLIMNIDDLFSLNLLNFIGHSISFNLLDTNGIYQTLNGLYSAQSQIYVENLTDYLNKSDLIIPVETIMNKSRINNISNCYTFGDRIKKMKVDPYLRASVPSGGDFTLLHNSSLYNFYGGGYVETCANQHFDTEFIIRQVEINKLTPYYIHQNCGYYHIHHKKQKKHRNEHRKYIIANETNKVINCDQTNTGIFLYIHNNKKLPNDTFWFKTYSKQDKNWGIKDQVFNFTLF